jgi:hypothetical protein
MPPIVPDVARGREQVQRTPGHGRTGQRRRDGVVLYDLTRPAG